MPTSMHLIGLKHESIWAWCTMAGLLFNHVVLERDALGVFFLKPLFRSVDRGEDLDGGMPRSARRHAPTQADGRPLKITFGEMREMGVRGVLVYCGHRCGHHHIALDADRSPDDIRLSDIEPRFICQACGRRGAEVRPDFDGGKPPTAAMGIDSGQRRSRPGVWVAGAVAGEYVAALPKKEPDAPEWRAAMEALLLVVELGGPTLFARTGIMRALSRHYVPEFNPKGKEPHWGRRKLKRDQ